MDREVLEIVYAANDGYARHLGVSMYSLFDSNREFKWIRVHVLSMGVSKESRSSLRRIAADFDREVSFIEVEDLYSRLGETADTGGYDISIMLRLFMGELLPDDIERIVYLDCDTVVLGSLKRLWCEELGGNVAGAVMEPTIYREVKESIGLEPGEAYYNSGVLMVDLERWREEEIQRKLLELWKEKSGKLFASDQDVLNGVLRGRIHTLMPRYNFFTNYRYFSYATLVQHSPSYRAVSKKQLRLAKRCPVIVHYMGDERPWIRGNLNHYRKAYEYYLAKTPWAGASKEKGKVLYMLAYHLMDYVTAICPVIRWEISHRLGMKLVESRKQ